ncbi:MAG: hypothetical protein J6X33_05320 [Clostridiales bacterium]|nr:hypothetical protein [Clostridiales bacterium]
MKDTREVNMPFSSAFARINDLPAKKVAIAVTVFFAILSSVVVCFHEPWLDEAQSWLIARDASYYDIFLVLPHVEGHVPFWWFLLSIPAKLGVPYEIGLKAVNIIIAIAACAVFEFKSPFPNAFKILFPFTYFFFYQYAQISRPYMLLVLALFIAAMTFRSRTDKPWAHLLSLILLCLSDTFGIGAAGGIAVAWTLSVIASIARKDKKNIRSNVKQAVCLAVLLVSALIMIWNITPNLDATATGNINAANIIKAFVSELFIVPSELCFTTFTLYGPLAAQELGIVQLIIAGLLSIVIWAMFFKAFLHKDIALDIVLPIFIFAAAGSLYIYSHHYGLLLMLGIYCAWISLERHKSVGVSKDLFSGIGAVICAVAVFMGLMWTGFSAVNDICHPYWVSRDLYTWIEANDLESCTWLAVWDIEVEDGKILSQNTGVTREAIPVNPYLKSSKPLNYNNEGYTYALFRDNSDAENAADIEKWKMAPEPDLILCSDVAEVMAVIDEMGYTSTYDIVYVKECRSTWKADFTKGGAIVYARRESALPIKPDIADLPSIMGQG